MKLYVSLIAAMLFSLTVIGEIVRIYPEMDAFVGSKYQTSTVGDTKTIRIGGWGDEYVGLWRFDVSTIPKGSIINNAWLYMYPDEDANDKENKLVTSCDIMLLTKSWKEDGTRYSNIRGNNYGKIKLSENDGFTFDAKEFVQNWMNGSNYGIALIPNQTRNNYYHFPSREARGGSKPRIVVNYTEAPPSFKMPLPSGKSWQLTVEPGGGKFYGGSDDPYHKGEKHYSLDFVPRYLTSSKKVVTATDVSILAMAGGYVLEVGNDRNNPNGYYVKIDHDGDGDKRTGFQTVYGHTQDTPLVKKGSTVVQGQKLGIMGNTGISFGTHLHVSFYYRSTAKAIWDGTDNGLSIGDDKELNSVTMEDRYLWTYKLGSPKSEPVYYPSSNIEK